MSGLTSFYSDIKHILEQARSRTRSAVNSAMVEAYWLIGKRIVEEEQQGEQKAKYGKRLIEDLSAALTSDFGRGFSYANLYNCRQFYLQFSEQEILYTLCRELSWSHLRLIMRVDSATAIEYYCHEAREQNWTVRQLERNIKSHSFQRLLSTQANKTENNSIPQHLDFIKDPYVLEFLQLPEAAQLKESRLEQSIIDELQKFLLEMGKGFSFVARQMRISTETSHFYIDLVFYNYLLKCFVIIDLKTCKSANSAIRISARWICMCVCSMILSGAKTITPPLVLFSATARTKPLSNTLYSRKTSSFSPQNTSEYCPQKRS